MRAIIKQTDGEKLSSLIYWAEENSCAIAGMVLHEIVNDLKEKSMLKEIPQTEIMEKHFHSQSILKDIKISRYFEIAKQ